MAEGLRRKKNVRAGHRGSVTKLIKQVEEAIAAAPTTRIDTLKLSQLKMSLTEKLDTIKHLDDEILGLIEEEAVAGEIEQSDELKENIYTAIVSIESHCTKETAKKSTPPPTHVRTVPAHSRVKLPELSLRSFDGDITKWTTFWESYESSIHRNDGLSDIDKFNYLKSLLEKTAREAIEGLQLTSANYREAIAILEKRFGNKRAIIAKHMEVLLNLEAVTSMHDIKGLRRLYDVVETNVRSLRSLGVESDTYGNLLSSVFSNKLPTELRLIVSRNLKEDEWELDKFMEIVEQEIIARERASTAASEATLKKQVRTQPTAVALLSNSSEPTCCYCRQAHFSNNCKKVTDIDKRKEILRARGRCYNCLRRGHISRDCHSNSRCTSCNGKHHTTICSKSSIHKDTQESTDKSVQLNPQAKPFNSAHTVQLYANASKSILLQTAQAHICNPTALTVPPMQVRIVLDNGSQRSYISELARNQLSVRSQGTQVMSIATFGRRGNNPQLCDTVTIELKLKNGSSMNLTLFVVPTICEPLRREPVGLCIESCEHLTQLELADSFEDSEIDVLIGSDYY